MSDANAIKAGEAYVRIYGDKDPLKKDLKESKGALEAFGAEVASIGAATGAGLAGAAGLIAGAFRTTADVGTSAFSAVGAVITTTQEKLATWGSTVTNIGGAIFGAGAAIKGLLGAALATFEEMGSAMQRMSDKTGVSVEALSTLGFAAKQSGASVEGLEGSIQHLGKALSGVGEDSKNVTQALGQLGVNLTDLKKLSPDEQFRLIASRLARIADPTIRAAGAMKIFGSSGESILPMLAHGADHMKTLEDRARSLGLEMSGKDTKSADALHLALAELWATVKMVSFAVGAPLADSMREMVKLATDVVSKVLRWVRENGAMIVNVNNLATALMAAGGAIIAVGTVLSGMAATIGYITAALATVLSPVGLTVAALAGLGYAFVTYTQMGQEALGWLSAKFNELKTDGMAAFDGISAALKAGDIGGAMKVAGALLMLEWTKAIQFLEEKWINFKASAIGIAVDIAGGIANAFIDAFAKIKKMMIDAQTEFTNLGVSLNPLLSADAKSATQLANNLAAINAKGNVAAEANGRKEGVAGFLDPIKAGAEKDRAEGIAGLTDDVPARQKAFDDAVAEAKRRREKGPEKEKEPAITANFADAARGAKAARGLSGADVRSSEGFKGVAAALQQSRDEPQRQSAKRLAEIAEQQQRDARYTKRMSDDIHNNLGVFGF